MNYMSWKKEGKKEKKRTKRINLFCFDNVFYAQWLFQVLLNQKLFAHNLISINGTKKKNHKHKKLVNITYILNFWKQNQKTKYQIIKVVEIKVLVVC